jgi:2-polyprenyl-3-methyl-5-hydroxy-6-metoxy-1,4-benzoquinol methylase
MSKNDIHCSICNAVNIDFLAEIRPYSDMEWFFKIYECRECGVRFAFRDPSINYHEILHRSQGGGYNRHYDIAEKVKQYLETGDPDKCELYLNNTAYTYDELIKFVKGVRDKSHGPLHILEIGCSTGYMTAFLRYLGCEAEGIDISKSAINYARNNFGSFYHENPSKEQYDVIYHLGLIGCVDNPRQFLSYYLSLLKPDGIMFFNAPNVESPKKKGNLWVSTLPPDLIYLFNEASFQHMLGNSYHVTCIKRHKTKGSLISRLTKSKVKNTDSISSIFSPRTQHMKNSKKKSMKGIINRVLVKADQSLLSLPLFKKYDSEYGLFFTITKRNSW